MTRFYLRLNFYWVLVSAVWHFRVDWWMWLDHDYWLSNFHFRRFSHKHRSRKSRWECRFSVLANYRPFLFPSWLYPLIFFFSLLKLVLANLLFLKSSLWLAVEFVLSGRLSPLVIFFRLFLVHFCLWFASGLLSWSCLRTRFLNFWRHEGKVCDWTCHIVPPPRLWSHQRRRQKLTVHHILNWNWLVFLHREVIRRQSSLFAKNLSFFQI